MCLSVMLLTRAGVGVALFALNVAPGTVCTSVAHTGPGACTSIAGSTAARPGAPGTPGAGCRTCVKRRERFIA